MSAKPEEHSTPPEKPLISRDNGVLVISDSPLEARAGEKFVVGFAAFILIVSIFTPGGPVFASFLLVMVFTFVVWLRDQPATELRVDASECKIRIGKWRPDDFTPTRVLDFADIQEVAVLYHSDNGYLPYLLLRSGEDVLCPSRGAASQEQAELVVEAIRSEMAQAIATELQ